MNASKTYYDILGVAPDATQDAIRTAFRSAAKRYHPDHFPSYFQKVWATAKMQEINAAYAVLRNPNARRAYDATLPKLAMGSSDHIPSRSKTRKAPSGGGAAATVMSSVRRSFRMERTEAWMIIVWLSASLAFGYSQWSAKQFNTLAAFFLFAFYSLVVSGAVLVVVALVLMFFFMIVYRFVYEGFQARTRAMPSRKGKIVLDMLLRLVGLATVVGVGVAAWHFDFMPDLLAYGLLAAGAGLIGELAAMIVYLFRRSVVHSTEMLLRMSP